MEGVDRSKITRVASGIVIITFLSKLLGFFREVLIASNLGATYQTDAYLIAIMIPSILFASIIGAVGTSFVPVYLKINLKQGRAEGIKFTNNLLNIVLVVSLVLTILGICFAKQIVSIIAIGFSQEAIGLGTQLTQIIFPIIIFTGLVTMGSEFLQSNDQFIIPAVRGIPTNIIMIMGLLMYSKIGILGLAWITLLGTAAQFIIQIPWLKKKGYSYRVKINLKDENIRYTFKLVFPVLIGVAVQQFNTFFDRLLASGLIEGSIAALNFAEKLNDFIFGIISVSIITIIYPMLSKFNVSEDVHRFKAMIVFSLNLIMILVIPMVVGAMIFSVPLVRLLFERGVFDQQATHRTASALIFYSLGTLAFVFREILNKVFYSIHDTTTPMINGTISLLINIVLNFILVKCMGHNGLALATSLSAIISVSLLFYHMDKKLGSIHPYKILMVGIKALISALIMGVGAYMFYRFLLSVIPQESFLLEVITLGGTIAIGAGIYFILLYLFGIEELHWIRASIKKYK